MLSVLIPVYNYDISVLVKELHAQLQHSKILFEIICLDDCSTIPYAENLLINGLSNCSYTILEKNIGRSSIRNLLAKNATYENLLFLDADTKVIKNGFIQNYLKTIVSETQIIYGGIEYQKEKPSKNELLRWIYGKKREALKVSDRNKFSHLRFLTLNFVMKKRIFEQLKFNEDIPNLRHEDTLFALDAKRMNIGVKHIDNPILHLGLESSDVFLKKSLEACESLKLFVDMGLIDAKDTSLSRIAKTMQTYKLSFAIKGFFQIFKKPMRANLLSDKPSLYIFDIYRLGYYLQIKDV